MSGDLTISRQLIADALMVDVATLPEGDLPLPRFADRYLSLISVDEDAYGTHPEVWTADLMFDLVRDHRDMAFEAIRATLARCTTPEQVAMLAAGPLEDLLTEHGPEMIDRVLAEAEASDRFRYALTGVWKNEIKPMVWARLESARTGPSLDGGDPVPPA